MITLRPYQVDIAQRAAAIIEKHGFVYFSIAVRCGKTLMALETARLLGVKDVLFLTKKKAIGSIKDDFRMFAPGFRMYTTNYESLHKVPRGNWGLIVCDEAHRMGGAFPKASKSAFLVKSLIGRTGAKVILMSGTPTPESYCQMYHQVYGIPTNPFHRLSNFYRFADDYVDKYQMKINGFPVTRYERGRPSIIEKMEPYMIKFSQEEAGFVNVIEEQVLEVELLPATYDIIRRLSRDKVVEGKEDVILGDTAVKLMGKVHQLCSGTIKFEKRPDGTQRSMVVDSSKAVYIRDRFKRKKIGIFYKFKAELSALMDVFGKEALTESLEEFNDTDKSIALQIQAGREGISLKAADALVYYNIDFSATSYFQSRDRMTTKDRRYSKIYWVFARGGIERRIYDTVTKKKDYTLNYFKRDFL